MIANPPPPMLPAAGCVTASANPVATAASTALPPAARISSPASDAAAEFDTTISCFAKSAAPPALNRQSVGKLAGVAGGGAPSGAGAGAAGPRHAARSANDAEMVQERRSLITWLT